MIETTLWFIWILSRLARIALIEDTSGFKPKKIYLESLLLRIDYRHVRNPALDFNSDNIYFIGTTFLVSTSSSYHPPPSQITINHENSKILNLFPSTSHRSAISHARFNLSCTCQPCRFRKKIIRKKVFFHVYTKLLCYSLLSAELKGEWWVSCSITSGSSFWTKPSP